MSLPINICELAGANPRSRFAAANVRRRISTRLEFSDLIILDFKGIESISDTFIDECFAKLYMSKDEFSVRIELKDASPYILTEINQNLKKSSTRELVRRIQRSRITKSPNRALF